jgi:hypothetical protein
MESSNKAIEDNLMVANGDEIDELDHISRVALLIDDLSNEDPHAKLHSIQRLTQIAQLLGMNLNT